MNTRDDDEIEYLRQWSFDRRRRVHKGVRWLRFMVYGACLVVVAMLIVDRAEAGSANLTCVLPTTKIDGTGLTDLAGIDWLYGASGGALLPLATTPGCSYTANNLSAGTWYFAAKALKTDGTPSPISNIASKVIAADPPPTLVLTAAAGTAAYTIKPDYTTFGPMLVSTKVGTVRTETACSARQRIVGTDYYRVPKTAVAFLGAAKDYVVAKCVQS